MAQTNVLTATAKPVSAKRGGTLTVPVEVHLAPGYHANSNTPSDEYLIGMKITWDKGPLTPKASRFPKPRMETYAFSDKPLSVFSGDFVIETDFDVPAKAEPGMSMLSGKLRYQACSQTMCLQPKTVDVKVATEIR